MNTRHLGLLCGVAACVVSLSGLASAGAAAAERVPELNVKQSCREAQAVSADGDARNSGDGQPDTYKACMQDETQAHDQLAQRWSKFKPNNRRNCVAQANPSPSYVEILTCLEMNDEAGIPYKADSSSIAPASPTPSTGSPSQRPTTGSPASSKGGRI